MEYGACTDTVDKYVMMGDGTARECLEYFAVGVVALYKKYCST